MKLKRKTVWVSLGLVLATVLTIMGILRGNRAPNGLDELLWYLIGAEFAFAVNVLSKMKSRDATDAHLQTIEALALAIEAKDEATQEHLQRVQCFAVEVGKEMGLSSGELQALRAAAILHDIGKLAVPEHILAKPGKLTPEEFEKMKIHPLVGAQILEAVRFPYPVAPIVRTHHEKWDGSGYPFGLKGEEIPLAARILSAVDCLDALASHRQYRPAVSLEEAMQVVESGSGKAFDPRVVAILQHRCRQLELLSRSQQNRRVKLTTSLTSGKGTRPAAGFEKSSARGPQGETPGKRPEFLSSIAAARQEAQLLLELGHELGSSLSLHETLAVLDHRLRNMIMYEAIAVYVRHEGRLVSSYANGENAQLFSSLEIPIGEGLSGWVAQHKKAIVNGHPAVKSSFPQRPQELGTMQSALAVPLQGADEVLGVLTLYRRDKDVFTKEDLRILTAISPRLAVAIENALRYRQAEMSAGIDGLTGLPAARSLFLHLDAELARCRQTNESLSIFVCDLDGFKLVNDRYGHLAGNQVLRKVAQGLKERCREHDYVARMGGDEFVLVLPGMKGQMIADKVDALAAVVTEAGAEICGEELLSLSTGVASYPENGGNAEELLAEADQRMYKAKRWKKSTAFDFDYPKGLGRLANRIRQSATKA